MAQRARSEWDHRPQVVHRVVDAARDRRGLRRGRHVHHERREVVLVRPEVAEDRVEVRQHGWEGAEHAAQLVEEAGAGRQAPLRGVGQRADAVHQRVEVGRQRVDLLDGRPERPRERAQLRDRRVHPLAERCKPLHRV